MKGDKSDRGGCSPMICKTHPGEDSKTHYSRLWHDPDYDPNQCEFIVVLAQGRASLIV